MVSLNGFSLKVPDCIEETSDGYAVMQHGQQYSLNLSNHHKDGGQNKPCDADVYIDGKFCGCFRIPAGQNISLKRSAIDSGRFTALKRGSAEALLAEIDPSSPEMGLIEVVFKPGTKKTRIARVTPIIESWTYATKTPSPWTPAPGVYAYAVTSWESVDSFSNNSASLLNGSSSITYRGLQSSSFTSNSDSLVGGGTGLTGQSGQEFDEVDELSYSENSTTLFLRLAFRDEPRVLDDCAAKKVYSTRVPRPLK